MPVLAWFANVVSTPVVANLLWPALSRALSEFFMNQAKRHEENASRIQALAAGKIADAAKRAEALREASRKISDASSRD